MVLGPWLWNVVSAMTQAKPPPPVHPASPALYEGPHPAVLLWSDSQYCAVSHGEEIILHWLDQALAGTGRGCEGGDVQPYEVREKETDGQKSERKGERENPDLAEKLIHSAKSSSLFCLIPQPSHSSALSNPFSPPSSVILSALLPWVSAVCGAAKL